MTSKQEKEEIGDLLEFPTPTIDPTSSTPKPAGTGFKVPGLDLVKAAEFNATNPETPEDGIEWAETDEDIKPEDAEVIDNSFKDLYN